MQKRNATFPLGNRIRMEIAVRLGQCPCKFSSCNVTYDLKKEKF